jgi:glycosyltransferase involved in cell wall biosynthesis
MWVSDFRDAWVKYPAKFLKENRILRINFLNHFVEKYYEKRVIKISDKVVTASEGITEDFIKRYHIKSSDSHKIATITNGFDEKDFESIEYVKNKEQFRLIYFGVLNAHKSPFNFLKAFSIFINNLNDEEKKCITVDFFGRNRFQRKSDKALKNLNIEKYINFNNSISHGDLLKRASTYDMSIFLMGDFKYTDTIYTGKIFELIRLDIPLLAIAPINGVAANLVKKINNGFVVDFNNINNIVDTLHLSFIKWKDRTLVSDYKSNKNYSLLKAYERKKFN